MVRIGIVGVGFMGMIHYLNRFDSLFFRIFLAYIDFQAAS